MFSGSGGSAATPIGVALADAAVLPPPTLLPLGVVGVHVVELSPAGADRLLLRHRQLPVALVEPLAGPQVQIVLLDHLLSSFVHPTVLVAHKVLEPSKELWVVAKKHWH